jgi:hypothetical protein
MNTLGAAISTLLVAVVLFGSRRAAALALLAGILYLTQQQNVNVGGFNVYAFRLLEIAGFVRLVVKREALANGLNGIDKLVTAVYGYTVLVYLMRSDEGGAAYQIGTAVDAFLCYFCFRAVIAGIDDYTWLMKRLVLLLVPYAALVVRESLTLENPFALIGGVELARAGDVWVREGRLRATGSFGHPSLLGTFGAAFLPLYASVFVASDRRWLLGLGLGACLVIVWATNSGGPAACVLAAVAGGVLWPLRRHMGWFRIAVAVILLALVVIMKAPIWYVLARISSVTGGGGFHRAALLDAAFQNFDQWWLAGMPALATSRWLPYTNTNTGAVDMTNNFLQFGIAAGLGAVLLLIALICVAFRRLGLAMERVRAQASEGGSSTEYVLWGLGVMIGVHLFNWFSIAYWDQSNVVWFLHLALVSTLAGNLRDTEKELTDHPIYSHARQDQT